MIIKQIIDNLNKSNLLNIKNLEDSFNYDKDIYESITETSKLNKFKYLVLIVCSIYIFNKFTVKINYIYGIIFSIMIIYFFIQKDNKSFETSNNNFNKKLLFINKCLYLNENYINKKEKDNTIFTTKNHSYFYDYPLFIEFYFNIKEYADYNFKVYRSILHSTNNFLKLYNDLNIGLENPNANKDVAMQFYKLTMNNYQSFIYSVPCTKVSNDKFNKQMNILYNIFQIYIKNINNICKKKFLNTEITNQSVPDETIEVYPYSKDNSFNIF